MTINRQDNFSTIEDIEIGKEFLEQGYIIRPIKNIKDLDWIRNLFIKLVRKNLTIKDEVNDDNLFDLIHYEINPSQLNNFRLSIIKEMNATDGFRYRYYQVAKSYLEALVGNELAMQSRVNLSIQLPNDASSLLATHADTWSGDSPFEVVVWLPLVDCYKTKAMYLLPPDKNLNLNKNFKQMSGNNSEYLFKSIESDIKWIDINYGEVMVFNQALPHGNRINQENETRWSMNCRFKGLFTPYNDKKIGEFFEPITIKPASVLGMSYQHPKL